MDLVFILTALFILLVTGSATAILYLIFHIRKLEQKLQTTQQIHTTETKELQSSKEELREQKLHANDGWIFTDVVESLDTGILIADMTKHIILANDQASKVLGKTRDSLGGKELVDVFTLVDASKKPSNDMLHPAWDGKRIDFTYWTFIKTDILDIPIKGFASPVYHENTQTGLVLMFEDATEEFKKQSEEQMFLSQAAHELRAPMTSIEAALTLLTTNFERTPPEKIKELLVQTVEYVTRLKRIVNDFLNITRIQQNRLLLTVEKLNIVKLTDDVIAINKTLIQTKHLYIHHEYTDLPTPFVNADENKTREVLINLISNAVKYTQQGGVTILHKAKDGKISTIVTDTGCGIHKQYHNLLFKRFQQMGKPDAPRPVESTGLGLYISRELARCMKGDVLLLDSEPGKGSSFEFFLPVFHQN